MSSIPAPTPAQSQVEHLVLRSVDSLAGIERWSQIRRLTLEGCGLPDLAALRSLPSLAQLDVWATTVDTLAAGGALNVSRFTAFGTNQWSPDELIALVPNAELVLRAVPWHRSGRLPFAGRSVVLSAGGNIAANQTSWGRHRICCDELPSGEFVAISPGLSLPFEEAVLRVPYEDIMDVISLQRPEGEAWRLLREVGTPASELLGELVDRPSLYVEALLPHVEKTPVVAPLVKLLERFVSLPAHEPRPRQEMEGSLLLRALVHWGSQLGPAESSLAIRVKGPDAVAGYWSWTPRGAWDPASVTLDDGTRTHSIAINDESERAILVSLANDAVWVADIGEYEPGRVLPAKKVRPAGVGLAELLDAIDAVRLPEGTVVEGTVG